MPNHKPIWTDLDIGGRPAIPPRRTDVPGRLGFSLTGTWSRASGRASRGDVASPPYEKSRSFFGVLSLAPTISSGANRS